MPTHRSTYHWTPLDVPITTGLGGGAFELPSIQWSHVFLKLPQLRRIGVDPCTSILNGTSASSGIVAALITERYDSKDSPRCWNYDRYLIARASDGNHWMSSPTPSADPPHHSSCPSTWFEGLRAS